jgi:selenocysteine lyase/cysteine desulfurase
VESTSHGLQVAAASIPLSEGDEILMASWDFLGVPLTWKPALEKKGARLREVDLRGVEDPTAVLIDSLRPETRVVCTSSVTEVEGIRLRLADLAEACHRTPCWLVVDVIQESGVRRMDLASSGVDFAAAGGHKWLGCPFGVGFLYVRAERLKELQAPSVGYLGLEPPSGGWGAYLSSPDAPPVTELAAAREARRFEIGGTPNFPGRFAMAESCSLLNRAGIDHIETHVLELTGFLWERLAAMGFRLVSHRDNEARAGIVCFSLGDPTRDRNLEKELALQRIHVSCRYRNGSGGVRASLHWYNCREDVERFISTLEGMRNRGAILVR